MALLALATVGGPGAIFLVSLLGWLGVIAAWMPFLRLEPFQLWGLGAEDSGRNRTSSPRVIVYWKGIGSRGKIAGAGLALVMALILFSLTIRPPALFDVQLTPYKSLYQTLLYPGSQIIFQEWNAFSRVDVVRSPGIRSVPGLSFVYPGELPPQLGLLVDGDNLSPISRSPVMGRPFTTDLPLALSFRLRPAAPTPKILDAPVTLKPW